MSRADKVWLAIAIVAVIAMASGVGALLYRRSEVVAAEQGRSVEATVTLASITPTPPVATSKPAPPPPPPSVEPTIPEPPAPGALLGYITKIVKSDAGFTISFDAAKLTTGEEAVTAANKAKDVPTNGWFIANETHTIVKHEMDAKATVVVMKPIKSGPGTMTITPQAFRDAFPSGEAEDTRMQKAPFWLVVQDGRVVRVVELIPKR